jgi:hypothetical protein
MAMHKKHPKGHLTARQMASARRNLAKANARRHHRATATKVASDAFVGQDLVPEVVLPVASSSTKSSTSKKLRSERGARIRLSTRNVGARAKMNFYNRGARPTTNPESAGKRAAKRAADLKATRIPATQPYLAHPKKGKKQSKVRRSAHHNLREFRKKQRAHSRWSRKAVKAHHW